MYRATRPLFMPNGGQRRILKRRSSVPEYIRQAVQSGTYRTTEELHRMRSEMNGDVVDGNAAPEDESVTQRRMRMNVVRGSSIVDYPSEYVILQQHPPLPDPPRTPERLRHLRREKTDPRVQSLVHKYYHRQQQQQQQRQRSPRRRRDDDDTTDTDWYYRRLLHVPPPRTGASSGGDAAHHLLSTKSVALQRAYQAAVQHHQLERTTADDDDMTESDVTRRVDDLMAEARAREHAVATATAVTARSWRRQQTPSVDNVVIATEKRQREDEDDPSRDARTPDGTSAGGNNAANTTDDAADDAATYEDVMTTLTSHPRTWRALQKWSDRLRAVPYAQWTTGAATALDHWLAVTVLGLSEDSWQALLQGEDEDDDGEVGAALVAVRQALFPETVLDARILPTTTTTTTEEEEKRSLHETEGSPRTDVNELLEEIDDVVDFGEEEEDEQESSGSKSLEELLASLRDISKDEQEQEEQQQQQQQQEQEQQQQEQDDPSASVPEKEDLPPGTDRVTAMTTQLQDYRRQHQSGTLDDATFAGWARRYQETLGVTTAVSHEDFRAALLSEKPLDRDVSDAFWDALTTPAGGHHHGPADVKTWMSAASGNGGNVLDDDMAAVAARYGVAADDAEGLWNLAALRPLLDEFVSEKEREAFLNKYGDILLEGVPLEYLTVVVDDRNNKNDDAGGGGTVPAGDLPPRWAAALPATARVRLRTLAYRRNLDDDLYRLWKEHKAGRARYEEKLFRTKRLGLAYDQVDMNLYDRDYQGDDEDDYDE